MMTYNFNMENRKHIFFPVYEQQVKGVLNDVVAEDKKMLTKYNPETKETEYLSVVNKNYRVVENEEILLPLQQQMINYFDPSVLEEITVKDTVAKNRAAFYSEYIFPRLNKGVETTNGHKTSFGLRYIVKNTFDGSGSVTMWGGLIDFFCTNGTVIGEYDITRKRHSKNFEVDGFVSAFEASMNRFDNVVSQYQVYADSKLVRNDNYVRDFFRTLVKGNADEPKRTNGLSDRLFAQWIDEVQDRGNNIFSVMSTLTHYASHDDERFPLTKAADADSLYKRQEKVTGWLGSKVWSDFVDANRPPVLVA